MPTRGRARSSNDTTGACAPPARVPRHHAHSQRRTVPLARRRAAPLAYRCPVHTLAAQQRVAPPPHAFVPHCTPSRRAARPLPPRSRSRRPVRPSNDPRHSPVGPHGAVLRAPPPSACPAAPTMSSVHPAVPFAPRHAAFEPRGAIFGPHGSVLCDSPPSARPTEPPCAPRRALLTHHGAVSC
ncbi:hypothetical protein DENSPDRAFT_886823 [Dentipellis sp. KUC8613]|nr:hypothetical protein DENSPDRAFT_886823 [Dentipellis sp. KUC8613]